MNTSVLAQPSQDSQTKRERLREIIAEKSVRLGNFQLASGTRSDLYFDMKNALLDREGLDLASDLIMEEIERFPQVSAVGGLIIGACPITTAICLKSRPSKPLSGFYVRKDRKTMGTTQLIEGPVEARSDVIVLDDVTTEGESVLKAIRAVREELDCNVIAVVTVVDREQGAAKALAEEGLDLISLFVMSEFNDWRSRRTQ